jgi:outer membrane protein OmpA-like peptidoglycan-associated protein
MEHAEAERAVMKTAAAKQEAAKKAAEAEQLAQELAIDKKHAQEAAHEASHDPAATDADHLPPEPTPVVTAVKSDVTAQIEALLARAMIEFDPNEASITPASDKTIVDVAALLKDIFGRYFIVDGYSDTGRRPEKLAAGLTDLTRRRAKAVRAALIQRGVDPCMLVGRGNGNVERNPLTGRPTPAHANKRVYIYEINKAQWGELHTGQYLMSAEWYAVKARQPLWHRVSDGLSNEFDRQFGDIPAQYFGLHEAIDMAVSHPHLPKPFGSHWTYKILDLATVRRGVSLTSDAVDIPRLAAGTVVQALDWRINESGQTRIQVGSPGLCTL